MPPPGLIAPALPPTGEIEPPLGITSPPEPGELPAVGLLPPTPAPPIAADGVSEKPQAGEGWINGAFFVCEPEVFDYIDGDETQWEREPLERLAKDREVRAYRHFGFWQCMDTVRDKKLLEGLWSSGVAPWKTWE